MRAYENNPWLRRATLHNIRVRGLPAQLCAILLVRPTGTTITSPTLTIATVIVDIVVAIIQPHDLDHPFGALIPSRRFRLAKRGPPRGILDVDQGHAGPAGKLDERAGCGEMRVERGPVERGRACVVLRGEEGGGGGRAEGEEEVEELLRGSASGSLFSGGEGRRGGIFHSRMWLLAQAMCRMVLPFSSRASPSGAVPKRSMKELTSSRSP